MGSENDRTYAAGEYATGYRHGYIDAVTRYETEAKKGAGVIPFFLLVLLFVIFYLAGKHDAGDPRG